jgi:hypothetical protein
MAVRVMIPVPETGIGLVEATTSTASGITEVGLNGVPHIGLVLHNDETTILAVLTPDEAAQMAQGLSIAATGLGKRWAKGEGPKPKES